ncbi:uncharacterized protein [Montipora capricornis]|uniref:uncharacterized protein isoform X2 n=1 Tax=Montipora capricornis TaxID=246305 RepID=UPI0035F18519
MVVSGQDQKRNLPWVEKYRPNSLEDLISHKDIITTIKRFIDEERLPHLLFYGPPGTGKTSTILAVAKQIYSPREFNSMVLEVERLLTIIDVACPFSTRIAEKEQKRIKHYQDLQLYIYMYPCTCKNGSLKKSGMQKSICHPSCDWGTAKCE